MKIIKNDYLKSGYSNNPDYFGDWFGKGQIDFDAIINPEDDGDVWMVKMWSGSGYVLDVYLCKATDIYDAINTVFEWSWENEGENNMVFDYDYISNECHEEFERDPEYFGDDLSDDYEEFEMRWFEDYISDDNGLFARSENFFVDKVPENVLAENQKPVQNSRKPVKSSRKPIKSANYNGFNLEARRSYGKGNGYFTTYPVWDTDLDTGIGAIEYHYAVENPYYVAWVYDDFGANKTGRTKDFNTEEECLEWIGEELARGITSSRRPVKSSRRPVKSAKKSIKSGRYIKSGAGAGYDVTVRGIELDNRNWKILSDDYDEQYDLHTIQVEVPVKPCVAEYWAAESYYEGIDSSHDIYDSEMDRQIEGGTAILQMEVYPSQWIKGDIMTSEELDEAIGDLLPSELNLTMMYGGGWIHSYLPEEGITFDDDNGRIYLDEGETYDYTTVRCELKCPNITQNINAFFRNPDAYYDEDGMPQYPGEDDEIANSCKSVTSGLTFRQAVQDFKAAGQWNDYYEMQQDWEAYKDGLARDGVISEKTESTWGNPCTPEGFKRWNKQ